MSDIAIRSTSGRTLEVLDRVALGAALFLPLLLLHAHGFAEAAIGIIDLCFLARSAITRDWAWIRTPWLLIGWGWWGWVVLCSLPLHSLDLGEGGTQSLAQAVMLVRFLALVAALEHAVLRSQDARRWLYWTIAASAAYIAIHVLAQFVTGHNLYGEPPSGDSELTGPFGKPRAGPPFARIILPAVIPWAAAMLARPGRWSMPMAFGGLIAGAVVALLIGQRMPFLLVCLGLVVVGLFLPKVRWGVIAAGVALVAMLAASPIVAPQAHYRLVEKFSRQMEHFSASHYGELYARAIEIGIRNPLTGMGADGFRAGCPRPEYFRPSWDGSEADGGGARICWHHPHNYYLEAFDNGGFPSLILFTALGCAWLASIGRGLWRQPDPLRVALLAAAAIQVWPIASTTGLSAMPVAGWSFLLLGWGLAEARWPNARATPI